jgi:hypothetical protein
MLEESRSLRVSETTYKGRYYPGFVPSSLIGADGTPFPSPSNFAELAAWAGSHPERGLELDEDDRRFVLGTYDGACTAADFQVGRLLDALDALGLSDRTVVVALSDHGEGLYDLDFFNHRFSLHDVNDRVVLLLAGPGVARGRREDPVALLDVAPTLLALAGLDPGGLPGRDLLAPPEAERLVPSESLLGEISLRSEAGRLIRRGPWGPPGPWPPEAPPGASLWDDAGAPLPWTDPLGARLWAAQERP